MLGEEYNPFTDIHRSSASLWFSWQSHDFMYHARF
jgi:hypothetical protein